MAREGPSLGRRRDDPYSARSWLVDDAYDPATGAARQLCLALRAGIRSIGPTDPAAVVAMAQPAAGTSRRSPALGARCRAPRARRSLRLDVRRLAHGLDGRDDVPRSHDQRLARDRRAAAGYRGGSVGAAVD